MGSKRWRLANKKKPKGQLSDTKEFLAASDDLSACRVAVPIAMDKKAAVLAAGGLAGTGTRSFEVWWDGAQKRLDPVLVAESKDLPSLKQAFANMYPNAQFLDTGDPIPKWFERDSQYRVFDIGTYHGHHTTVFDQTKTHEIMTLIANTVQLSKFAWIQFTFRSYSFNTFLRRHVAHLDQKMRQIREGRYLGTAEALLNPDREPHGHPEMGYDFTNNYPGLQKHATLKMQGPHLMMSIRGLFQSDSDIDLNFDGICPLPAEEICSNHEHLTKFSYGYSDFYDRSFAKTDHVKIGGCKTRRQRINIFESRLLPDPRPFLDRSFSSYFERGMLGYRDRRPFPFLILNPSEIPLLVHLPNPTTPNVETTRGVSLPARPSEKSGANIGFFGMGNRGGPDLQPMWGRTQRSRDIDAAVIAPADFATHIYGVGASGSGKTSLIRLLAKHLESWNGNGEFPNAFIYVDPKGDDSYKFIRQCEEQTLRQGRVHLLDPQLTGFSINPLELPPYARSERQQVVSRYVGYFMRTIEEWYQQSTVYVQMERIFRALLYYVYMRHDDPTFLDIHDIVIRLQDDGEDALPEIIRTFGMPEPEMKQALISIANLRGDSFNPLLNRIEQFATDPVLKGMFSVRRGTVNFDELIRPGHYTIVRISPLNMPQHVLPLAMQAFILKLWFTIQERADKVTDEKERTQVVLALDEFQIVKDLQVLQLMLEQSRSLGLGLVLSHQTTEQISDKQLGIITGNAGTQLVGKVNGKDAARLAQIWDPQFQQQLRQQLASQEYFHWTMQEKAPAGAGQPPPVQFWPNPPPELICSDEAYEGFVKSQLEKYGRGKIEASTLRRAHEAQTKWLGNISVLFPTRTQWRIMLMLKERQMQQAEIVRGLRVQNRADVAPVLREMVSQGVIRAVNEKRTSPYSLTERTIRDYFVYPFETIGTAKDVADVAGRVAQFYLRRGMFFVVASQKVRKGRDRTDLIAYDYSTDAPISIEIESISEVYSHPEHVRYNMVKWRDLGFKACHVWSKSPKVRQIYQEELSDDEKNGVTVIDCAD